MTGVSTASLPAGDFDAVAMYEAMDAQRRGRGLSWRQVADEIWRQSDALNVQRRDHPISPSTLTGIAKRGNTSCQHALFILRWLGRPPESFVPGANESATTALPRVGPDQRLRWNLRALYGALDAQRRERQLAWTQLAGSLGCTSRQVTGISTARFAISMQLAMRIVRWLERPAAAFVYAARW